MEETEEVVGPHLHRRTACKPRRRLVPSPPPPDGRGRGRRRRRWRRTTTAAARQSGPSRHDRPGGGVGETERTFSSAFFLRTRGGFRFFFFWDSRGRELLIFGVGVAEVDQ